VGKKQTRNRGRGIGENKKEKKGKLQPALEIVGEKKRKKEELNETRLRGRDWGSSIQAREKNKMRRRKYDPSRISGQLSWVRKKRHVSSKEGDLRTQPLVLAPKSKCSHHPYARFSGRDRAE